jgi:hypothetical protein
VEPRRPPRRAAPLEGYLVELGDPFMRKGLQLLVDGAEPERVREVLEVEIGVQEEQLSSPPGSGSRPAATRRPSASSARCWA